MVLTAQELCVIIWCMEYTEKTFDPTGADFKVYSNALKKLDNELDHFSHY